ncbi:MAG: helix-turn-helix transcriptional regulator [Bifidobacteriaceae bacterium]|nr:helix-turn-helix transcriptional regulator [Bifidobacteriaceae bacterium]
MSLTFIWVFCAFPTVDAGSVLEPHLQGSAQTLLRLAVVGLVPGILFPLASRLISQPSARVKLVAACSILRIVGCCVNVFALSWAEPLIPLFIGDSLMGISTTVYLVLWGTLLHYRDTESTEKAFIVAFVAVGTAILLISALFAEHVLFLLFVLPLGEFVLFVLAGREQPLDAKKTARTRRMPPYQALGKGFVLLLIRICASITLVSFVWEMFVTSPVALPLPKQAIFGTGLVLAALVIWLFTRYSSSVGFVAASRWVVPIMSVGLALISFPQVPALALGCLLLACAQGAFETILRIQVISFSREANYDPLHVVGWGFAATMGGAFAGAGGYNAICSGNGPANTAVIICVLAVLVVAGSLGFPRAAATGDVVMAQPSADVRARAAKVCVDFRLSPRESEVLGYLLEGRSHPYIRDHLYISKSTVDTHVRHIYSKTGVKSKQELIDLSKR